MPYEIRGKCIYRKDTGEKVGCTEGDVHKYLAALEANSNDSVPGAGDPLMAQAFFATRISDHMSRTPEGYLLCTGVPINRVGWQDYLGRELSPELEPDKVYKVYRPESEVFAPAAMASFEGKSITEGHPAERLLTVSNDNAYSKGHGQNVRRGEGEDGQASVCDLVIKDPVLISKVENGLREISCGYECVYVPQEDGTFLQTQIRGNHIAVVPSGRAGDRIAIKDELPKEIKKGEKKIVKNIKSMLYGLGFKQFAKDAEPEQIAEAMEAMKEGEAPAKKPAGDEPAPAPAPEAEHVKLLKELVAAVGEIRTRLEALEKGEEEEDHEEASSLDELESELTNSEQEGVVDCAPEGAQVHKVGDVEFFMNEEGKPVQIKQKSGDATKTTVIEPGKKEAEAAKAGDANAAILAGIRTMKPIIAAITDPAARKTATDALTASFRAQIATQATDKKSAYAKLGTAKQVLDEKAKTQATKDAEYGRKLKESKHRK